MLQRAVAKDTSCDRPEEQAPSLSALETDVPSSASQRASPSSGVSSLTPRESMINVYDPEINDLAQFPEHLRKYVRDFRKTMQRDGPWIKMVFKKDSGCAMPWCTLCGKWADEQHVTSQRHVRAKGYNTANAIEYYPRPGGSEPSQTATANHDVVVPFGAVESSAPSNAVLSGRSSANLRRPPPPAPPPWESLPRVVPSTSSSSRQLCPPSDCPPPPAPPPPPVSAPPLLNDYIEIKFSRSHGEKWGIRFLQSETDSHFVIIEDPTAGVVSTQRSVKKGDWIVAVNGFETIEDMRRELCSQECLLIRLRLKVQHLSTAEQQRALVNSSTASTAEQQLTPVDSSTDSEANERWDPRLKMTGWQKFTGSNDAWNPKYWWYHDETGSHFLLDECPSNGWQIFSYHDSRVVYWHAGTRHWFDE